MTSSPLTDRPWIVRGDSPTALLVPRAQPLPTADDVAASYERGRADGRRAAEAEREHAAVALHASAIAAQQSITEGLERARATTVALAVDLATELTRWLVNEAVTADPNVLRARLELAMEAIADEREAHFVVAASMADLVQTWLGPDAVVEADPTLEPGELRIDAGHASLDATYDVALGRARDALIRSFDERDGFELREAV
jgi:flagellar biosynthesis/type III secretory pathway protein FliH